MLILCGGVVVVCVCKGTIAWVHEHGVSTLNYMLPFLLSTLLHKDQVLQRT